MIALVNVIDLNSDDYAVIDLDTGTVLGTNVALVKVTEDAEEWESLLSSDHAAVDYAYRQGRGMFVAMPF
jgi:hypothetical protein